MHVLYCISTVLDKGSLKSYRKRNTPSYIKKIIKFTQICFLVTKAFQYHLPRVPDSRWIKVKEHQRWTSLLPVDTWDYLFWEWFRTKIMKGVKDMRPRPPSLGFFSLLLLINLEVRESYKAGKERHMGGRCKERPGWFPHPVLLPWDLFGNKVFHTPLNSFILDPS